LLLAVITVWEYSCWRPLLFVSLLDDRKGDCAQHETDANQSERDGSSRSVHASAPYGLPSADYKGNRTKYKEELAAVHGG
jgi:hypothetical protein